MMIAKLIVALAMVAVVAGDCSAMTSSVTNGSPGSGTGYCGDEGTFAEGAMCYVDCDAGYTAVGSPYVCTDGVWEGFQACDDINECDSAPCVHGECSNCLDSYECVCECNWDGTNCDELLACPETETPAFGVLTYTAETLLHGDTVTLTCNEGYTLEGTETMVCNCYGAYEPTTLGTCVPNSCPDVSAPEHGTVTSTTGVTLDEITYACINECDYDGCVYYDMEGDSTAQCEPTGEWSSPTPTCYEPSCDNLCTPTHGTVTYDNDGHTGDAYFACNEGYTLVGSSGAECGNGGVWTDTSCPTCEPNPCPDITPPEHGTATATSGVTGSSIGFTCSTEGGITYTMVGSPETYCSPDGTWTEEVPECRLPECTCPTSPVDGTSTCDGNTASFECNVGYTLTGSTGATCVSEGFWDDDSTPTCEPNPCPDVHAAEFSSACTAAAGCGTVASGSTTDVMWYDCDDGYHVCAGDELRTCMTDGTWSGEAATCCLSCTWETPTDGTTSISGTELHTECNCGYTLTGGEPDIVCTDAGWDPAPTTTYACEANPCSIFAVVHGSLSTSAASVGESVTVSCDSGYYLEGTSTLTCVPDPDTCSEMWSDYIPTCEPLSCSELGSPASGSVTYSDGLLYTSVASFECETGYTLVGDATVVCEVSGGVMGWSGEVPECEPNDCAPLSVVPDHGTLGTCETSLEADETCTITCDAGYEIVGTEYTCTGGALYSPDPQSCHDFDNCASGPCQNGGVCNDCVDEYTCICPLGWTGDSCEYACDAETGFCDCTSVTCSGEPVCGEGKVAVIYEAASETNCCDVYTCADASEPARILNKKANATPAGFKAQADAQADAAAAPQGVQAQTIAMVTVPVAAVALVAVFVGIKKRTGYTYAAVPLDDVEV